MGIAVTGCRTAEPVARWADKPAENSSEWWVWKTVEGAVWATWNAILWPFRTAWRAMFGVPNGRAGFPRRSFDGNEDMKTLEEELRESISIAQYYDDIAKPANYTEPTEMQKKMEYSKLRRNELVDGRVSLVDVHYTQYIATAAFKRQIFDTSTDFAQLGLNIAGTFAGGGTPQVLSAIDGAIIGGKRSIDKNFLYENTLNAIIAIMNANRRDVALSIKQKSKLPITEYPLSAALVDTYDYYMAGTFLWAIQSIQAAAANKDLQIQREEMLQEQADGKQKQVDTLLKLYQEREMLAHYRSQMGRPLTEQQKLEDYKYMFDVLAHLRDNNTISNAEKQALQRLSFAHNIQLNTWKLSQNRASSLMDALAKAVGLTQEKIDTRLQELSGWGNMPDDGSPSDLVEVEVVIRPSEELERLEDYKTIFWLFHKVQSDNNLSEDQNRTLVELADKYGFQLKDWSTVQESIAEFSDLIGVSPEEVDRRLGELQWVEVDLGPVIVEDVIVEPVVEGILSPSIEPSHIVDPTIVIPGASNLSNEEILRRVEDLREDGAGIRNELNNLRLNRY